MKPDDRLGDQEREIVARRRHDGYEAAADGPLAAFEAVLRSLLDQLLPGVPGAIDLAAFVDANTGQPLGRGDRPDGAPAEPDLFRAGLAALGERNFTALGPDEQRSLITRMRRGDADEELGLRAKLFVDRLLAKALTGYLAHPDTWERIGFNGPAYPEGYAWIGLDEVRARHDRKPGWGSL